LRQAHLRIETFLEISFSTKIEKQTYSLLKKGKGQAQSPVQTPVPPQKKRKEKKRKR
jgi:hypothetical protein